MNKFYIGEIITLVGRNRRILFKVLADNSFGEKRELLVMAVLHVTREGEKPIHPDSINGDAFWISENDAYSTWYAEWQTLKSIGARSISDAKRILIERFVADIPHGKTYEFGDLNLIGMYMSKRLVAEDRARCEWGKFTYYSDAWLREVGR